MCTFTLRKKSSTQKYYTEKLSFLLMQKETFIAMVGYYIPDPKLWVHFPSVSLHSMKGDVEECKICCQYAGSGKKKYPELSNTLKPFVNS